MTYRKTIYTARPMKPGRVNVSHIGTDVGRVAAWAQRAATRYGCRIVLFEDGVPIDVFHPTATSLMRYDCIPGYARHHGLVAQAN